MVGDVQRQALMAALQSAAAAGVDASYLQLGVKARFARHLPWPHEILLHWLGLLSLSLSYRHMAEERLRLLQAEAWARNCCTKQDIWAASP